MEEARSCAQELCVLVEQLLENYPDLTERMRALEHEGSIISKSRSDITPRDDASAIRRASDMVESIFQPGDTSTNRLTFEDTLESSAVYKRATYRFSQLSLTSTALYSTAISVFSKISLAQVSRVSFYALPVCAIDLNNSDFYVFGEEGAVLLDSPATLMAPCKDQASQSPVNNKPVLKPVFPGVAPPLVRMKRSSLLGRFATFQRGVPVSVPEQGRRRGPFGDTINTIGRLYHGARVQHEVKITRVVHHPDSKS